MPIDFISWVYCTGWMCQWFLSRNTVVCTDKRHLSYTVCLLIPFFLTVTTSPWSWGKIVFQKIRISYCYVIQLQIESKPRYLMFWLPVDLESCPRSIVSIKQLGKIQNPEKLFVCVYVHCVSCTCTVWVLGPEFILFWCT